jgi:hypothetical protein
MSDKNDCSIRIKSQVFFFIVSLPCPVLIFLFTYVAGPLLVSSFFRNDSLGRYEIVRIALSLLFPFFGYWNVADALVERSTGSTKQGVSWQEARDVNLLGEDSPVFFSMETTLLLFVASYFLHLVFALYFDQVLPNEYGKAQPLYFPLSPAYWGCRRRPKTEQVGCFGMCIVFFFDEISVAPKFCDTLEYFMYI